MLSIQFLYLDYIVIQTGMNNKSNIVVSINTATDSIKTVTVE